MLNLKFVCVRVRVCACACVRACVGACVGACVFVCVCVWGGGVVCAFFASLTLDKTT